MFIETRTISEGDGRYHAKVPTHFHRFDWIELSDRWHMVMGSESERSFSAHGASWAKEWSQQWKKSGWHGGSKQETSEWLLEGYEAPGFHSAVELIPTSDAPKWVWSDEGDEIDVGAALSGCDTPFMMRENAPIKPGINLVMNYTFMSGVYASTITDYGAWVGGVLSGLEAAGFDAVVTVRISLSGLERGDESGTKNTVVDIVVKKAGELSSFRSFSAMFSPSGFRQLGFLALVMATDERDKKASGGLGTVPVGKQGDAVKAWDVKYDETERTIEVCCNCMADRGYGNNGPSSFPTGDMTTKLMDTGII